GNPHQALKDKGVIDSGCSRHMTGNIFYLSDFEEINGGYVAFGGNPKGGKITGKDTECIVLSFDFKLPDEDHVLLKVPRENNMYNVDLKNIIPSGDLACLFAKATLDESNLWHRRLCRMKGIKREFSVATTPQHNEIAERKNKTLIESARTMLADSLLPIPFWVEAVNTACYVQNKNEIAERKNKTLIESARTMLADSLLPIPFWVEAVNTACYVQISKAFRVLNSRTRIVQETLHINFLEYQPNVTGSGPTWLFDIDTLTQSMNYQPVVAANQPISSADADTAFEVKEPESEVHVSSSSSDKTKKHVENTEREAKGKSLVDLSTGVRNLSEEFEDFSSNITNGVNAASALIIAVELNSTNSTNSFTVVGPSNNAVSPTFKFGGKSYFVNPSQYPDDPDMHALEEIVY
nr:hypothetical protein [Tanacetum cinerariifolium]GEZ68500.1 hypothetical protein [Tanacetum cinerariifolium]